MRSLASWSCLAAFCLAGCAGDGSPEDKLIQTENQLNQQLVEAISKAKDLAAVQEAMQQNAEKLKSVLTEIKRLPKDRLQKLSERFEADTAASRKAVDVALNKFQEKMLASGNLPMVQIDTSMGPVKVVLYDALAPITVKNFLAYADEGFFNGTLFHRVIPDFMIQGGGFLPGLKEKQDTRPTIKNEAFNGLSNQRGTIAMARTSDPDSAGAQWFINVKDNPFLDRARAQDGAGYTVFGRVTDGMDVVDKIKQVKTADRGGHEKVPVEDVVIQSVKRIEPEKK